MKKKLVTLGVLSLLVFANNQAQTKKPATKPAVAKPAAKSTAKPAAGKGTVIVISVLAEMMQYDKKTITVKAGQKVVLQLENPDGMQHNLVITKPGAMDKVGLAADDLARDPKGAEKNYVPTLPEVLFATKLLDPQETATLNFTAPSEPGDYPFMCTFPGHWRIMRGVMTVVK